MHEGLVEPCLPIAFGAIADAELNAEIGSDADEQHREGDRNQIKRADHHESNGGRRGETGDDAQRDRENDTARFQGEPNDQKNGYTCSRRVEPGAIRDVAELLVGHWHKPGQSDGHSRFGGNPKIARGPPDEIGRPLPRHQRRVIEHRLDLDETA